MTLYRNSLTESLYIAPSTVEPGVSMTIPVRPIISSVSPDVIVQNAHISVQGINFIVDTEAVKIDLKGVYLSAEEGVFENPLSVIDYFSEIQALSADYPPFNGILVEYTVTSKNTLTIKMPTVLTFNENIDIIVVNPFGYGKLSPIATSLPPGDSGALQNKLITVVNT